MLSKFLHFELVRSRSGIKRELKYEIMKNFIINSGSILHIGANAGQEAQFYADFNLRVLWIEADPDIFNQLSKTVKKFPNQTALSYLLNDHNGQVDFFVANNSGISSSIFQLSKNHGFEKLGLVQTHSKKLYDVTLDSLDQVKYGDFAHWIIDVQGAELNVLRGSINLLKNVKSLTIEVSTREVYENSTKWEDLIKFMDSYGFFACWEPESDQHEDVLFINKSYFYHLS